MIDWLIIEFANIIYQIIFKFKNDKYASNLTRSGHCDWNE